MERHPGVFGGTWTRPLLTGCRLYCGPAIDAVWYRAQNPRVSPDAVIRPMPADSRRQRHRPLRCPV